MATGYTIKLLKILRLTLSCLKRIIKNWKTDCFCYCFCFKLAYDIPKSNLRTIIRWSYDKLTIILWFRYFVNRAQVFEICSLTWQTNIRRNTSHTYRGDLTIVKLHFYKKKPRCTDVTVFDLRYITVEDSFIVCLVPRILDHDTDTSELICFYSLVLPFPTL